MVRVGRAGRSGEDASGLIVSKIRSGNQRYFLMTKRPLILFLSLLIICLVLPVAGSKPGMNEYFTRSGKSLSVIESHPGGQSLSNIQIESRGFAYNISESFEDHDPIHKVLVGDLDENGFDEFYIVTVSSGSGSYGDVLAFASNRDKSLSLIYFPDIQQGDERFTGYLGHDTFELEEGGLLRSFPIYLPSDTNDKPTGGTSATVYTLYPGEAGWQLKIDNALKLGNRSEN